MCNSVFRISSSGLALLSQMRQLKHTIVLILGRKIVCGLLPYCFSERNGSYFLNYTDLFYTCFTICSTLSIFFNHIKIDAFWDWKKKNWIPHFHQYIELNDANWTLLDQLKGPNDHLITPDQWFCAWHHRLPRQSFNFSSFGCYIIVLCGICDGLIGSSGFSVSHSLSSHPGCDRWLHDKCGWSVSVSSAEYCLNRNSCAALYPDVAKRVCETEFEVDEGVRVGCLPWLVCVVEHTHPQ